VLQARTAAAALMRAASTTTASLLVHLSDADLKPFDACSLLDAIVCECWARARILAFEQSSTLLGGRLAAFGSP
jgi:hypothetical protein